MKAWVLCLLLLFSAGTARALEPGEQLANPALEARARSIGSELRCLVCQNESIEQSNASIAHDIRIFLRKRLVAGDTDKQAIAAVVARYGTFVLLKPPVEPATYLLWYGPAALVGVSLLGTAVWLKRRSNTTQETAPLSAEEKSRLDGLMRGNDA